MSEINIGTKNGDIRSGDHSLYAKAAGEDGCISERQAKRDWAVGLIRWQDEWFQYFADEIKPRLRKKIADLSELIS